MAAYGVRRVRYGVLRSAGWLIVLGFACIGLAACGSGDDGVTVSPVTSVPTRTLVPPTATATLIPAMTTPTPTDLPGPATLAAMSSSTTVAELIPDAAQQLINAIARELSADDVTEPGELRLVSLEKFTWDDAAWGCAARRDESASVSDAEPVSGYRIIFVVGTRVYVYHTDDDETFFRCTDQDWLALQGEALPLDPIAESMVEMAARDVARRLGDTAPDPDLVGLLALTWPDSSVGCPQPGAEYDDRAMDGYRVVFRIGGDPSAEESPTTLIYHTSLQHVVRCDPDEEILPGFLRRAQPDPTLTPTPET